MITKGDETKVPTRNGRSASKVLSYMNYDTFQSVRQVWIWWAHVRWSWADTFFL